MSRSTRMNERTKYLVKCPHCRGSIRSDNNYCDHCGKLFLSHDTPTGPMPTWGKRLIIPLFLVAVIGLAIQFWPSSPPNGSHSETHKVSDKLFVSYDASGRQTYVRNDDGTITLVILGTPFGEETRPIRLADGSAVFQRWSDRCSYGGPCGDVYIVDPSGQKEKNLAYHTGFPCEGIAVSPDSSQIAYIYGTLKGSTMVVIDKDGNLIRKWNFFFCCGVPSSPSWSPDGTLIAFNEKPDKGIYTVDVNTGISKRLTSMGQNPSWAPNSKEIIFTSSHQVYSFNTDTQTMKYIGVIP